MFVAAAVIASTAAHAQQDRATNAPKAPAGPPDLDAKARGLIRPVDLSAFPPSYHAEFVAGPASGFDGAYLMLTRVPPRFGGPPLHQHSSDQIYFVVKGEMTVQLGTETFKAGPETLVFIPAGTPHRNWNATDQEEIHTEMLVPPPPPDKMISPADPRKIDDASSLIKRVGGKPSGNEHQSRARSLTMRAGGPETVKVSYDEVPPRSGDTALHVSNFDQVYYVVDGKMNLQLGLDLYTAIENTYILIPAGTIYRVWNGGHLVEKQLNLALPAVQGKARVDVTVTLATRR